MATRFISIDGYGSYEINESAFTPPPHDPIWDQLSAKAARGGGGSFRRAPFNDNYHPKSKSEEPDDNVTKGYVDRYNDQIRDKVREINDLTKAIQSPEDRLKELEAEMRRIQKEIDELLEKETK